MRQSVGEEYFELQYPSSLNELHAIEALALTIHGLELNRYFTGVAESAKVIQKPSVPPPESNVTSATSAPEVGAGSPRKHVPIRRAAVPDCYLLRRPMYADC